MSYLARFLAKKRGETTPPAPSNEPPKPSKPAEVFSGAPDGDLRNPQNPVSEVSEVPSPAIREIFPTPILSAIVPVPLEGFETSPAWPTPMTELDRLVGTYRAAYRRLDTTGQGQTLGEAAHHLHDLADRIRRLDSGFDFTTLHLEEGAAPITEPIPQVPVKAKSACYVCGGLEHWRTGGDRQPRKCSTCHPPANPDGIERERLEVEIEDEAWDEETAWLLDWQATAPTPPEAFWLRDGIWVSDPARFMARLRADAAHGPGGPRARTGAFQADLQALWGLFGGEDAR
ncbi:hypothetical protein D3C72_359090 [compost metagenome]